MIVQNICRGFLDALFPPLCLLCGEMSRGPHPHCCPECLAAFEPIGNSCCPLCGEPFPVRQHPHLCLRCRVRSRRPVPCRSLYMYRGAAARALSLLKYEKRLCILQPLTEAMLLAVGEPVRYSEVDLLIPVPVTRRGLWKRGFNQSAVLADSLGRYLEVPVERSALRRYGSHPQVGLGRRDRYRNAAESFGSGRCIDRVKGRRILIFDDVYTTGATVMTCAKILRNQGALVSILTFARTAPENIEHLVVDRSVRG